jgi:response regulator RpfG family c-di-GMP phosphodiesterase
MAGTEQTMKEVLQRLRRENSKAAEEAVELTEAVTEILRAQERLDAGLRELAAESVAIVTLADDSAVPRLQNLAAYAERLSAALGMHVAAFRELKRGLDGWKVQEACS